MGSKVKAKADVSEKQTHAHSHTEGSWVKLAICVLGIYTSFLTWGVLQERIATTPYGEDQRIFRASHVINIVQSTLACGVGYLFLLYQRSSSTDPKWKTAIVPSREILQSYLLVAVCQSVSSPLSYASMRYVDYLTVLLAKSGKLLPVMAVSILLYGRRFPFYKYVVVILITLGVSLFSWRAQQPSHGSTEVWGFVLLGTNLFLDGLYNTTQDQMFHKYKNITGPHMMFVLNFLTTVITFGMLSMSDQIKEFTWFMRHHPTVLRDILIYGLCGAVGQVFIFITLSEFGSLVLVTTTVTRKMVSMLLSVFMFNHKLSPLQWFGIVLVFFGVIGESVAKRFFK